MPCIIFTHLVNKSVDSHCFKSSKQFTLDIYESVCLIQKIPAMKDQTEKAIVKDRDGNIGEIDFDLLEEIKKEIPAYAV